MGGAQEEGLPALSQHAMRFTNRIGYHDYEGLALELDEQARLTRDLGNHKAMILRNHGLLACGESVAEAFDLMYYLERACQSQINAMAGGAKLRMPPPAVAEKTAGRPAFVPDLPTISERGLPAMTFTSGMACWRPRERRGPWSRGSTPKWSRH